MTVMGRTLTAGLWAAWAALGPATASAEAWERLFDVTPRPVAALAAGLKISEEPPPGWSHLVLQATPRLGAGDVEQAPAVVAKYATTFTTVILANVARVGENGPFYLDKVAIGQAVPIEGQLTIVTAAKHQELGAGLGFIGGRVLASSEEVMAKARQVARYRGMLIYDVPALMHVNNRHEELIVRHVVWVSERSGRLGSAMWVLRDKQDPQRLEFVGDALKFIPPGTREDRVLHVDGNEFTLGIPSAKAFAMTSLPPGQSFPVGEAFRTVAALRLYDEESLGRIGKVLSETLQGN